MGKNIRSLISLTSSRNLGFPSIKMHAKNHNTCDIVAKRNHRYFHISMKHDKDSIVSFILSTPSNVW